ncbi:MAG: flagellar basal-body rod protein FlgF [Deltaproteobacteria bacterium]|nr:flagellar basal-body rod protein FlgF [Deltaproteobacteria bacterium]MCW5804101.1 flagellar basal-body rod protein FlgF [Deltaproteobacteria bacterium]
MSSGIYIASAGAVAQSTALDATANNIANAATAGFHGDRITFREALTQARSPDLAVVGAGTARVDSQAGALTQSDNPLDVALDGDGYFGVQTPNGARYTRAGNFRLDDQRRLVSADGFPVRGEGGATISIPPEAKAIAIGADGQVSADGEEVGRLELSRFAPAQLKREGGTLLSARGNALTTGEPPKVKSGMLESSNVNVVRGVVDLVKVSRTYESLMRVIQGYHDIESRAARDLGGPK